MALQDLCVLGVLDVVVGKAARDLFVEEEPREEDDDIHGGEVHAARVAFEEGFEVVVMFGNLCQD